MAGFEAEDDERYIEEFKREGVVVVPIFSREEIATIREHFHRTLGVDHHKMMSGDAEEMSKLGDGARAKSPAAHVYASQWKLDVVMDQRLLRFVRKLMAATFGPANVPGFEHPFGPSDDIRVFLDGAQYRLPDHLRAEGGLGLHLDRNPFDPYLFHVSSSSSSSSPSSSSSSSSSSKKQQQQRSGKKKGKAATAAAESALQKFRPIQSWISLTDQYGSDSGGLRVVRRFHERIDEYFAAAGAAVGDVEDKKGEAAGMMSTTGEFYRLNPKTHAGLWKKATPVDAPAGCIVFWDNRLPHSTAPHLISGDTREILYTAYLPAISINVRYAKEQAAALRRNWPPPNFQSGSRSAISTIEFDSSTLSPLQAQLLGFQD